MADKAREDQVRLEELRFYFDSQEKNLLDLGSFAQRVGQVLNVRHRLLALPSVEFDRAIGAIEKIVSGPIQEKNSEKDSATRRDAIELFERTTSQAAHTNVDEVAKI